MPIPFTPPQLDLARCKEKSSIWRRCTLANEQTPKEAAEFLLQAIGSSMRAAEKAAVEQAGGQTTELSASLRAAAEAMASIGNGSQSGGTQCLWYPGPGNGKKIFNYDTGEWEEDC